MRIATWAVVVSLLALSGCAMTPPATSPEPLAGVWEGVITGRDMAGGSGMEADPLVLVIASDGTWTATKRTERWKGTSRWVDGRYELVGTTSSGRPISLSLTRQGAERLGGSIVMDYGGRPVSAFTNLAQTSSPTGVAGDNGSQPSALPSPAREAAPPQGLFERYPELQIQSR